MLLNQSTYNQELINKYFKSWIGVGVFLPADPADEPPILYLDFKSHCAAAHAYSFLVKWQDFPEPKKLCFSIIEEDDERISCYFYTPGFPFFERGRFSGNFNAEKLKRFMELQKDYPDFKLLTRYADKNYDIQDFEKQAETIELNTLRYRTRQSLKAGQVEFE